MQTSPGTLIRQFRRQRNLTQTALGGERFSKSYVSAVEHQKIKPSIEALHFFAEQLEQPVDLFLGSPHQDQGLELSLAHGTSCEELLLKDDLPAFLDFALEEAEFYSLPLLDTLPALSPEALRALPPAKRANYAFLEGLLNREQGDAVVAVQAFERALGSISTRYLPALLDELGLTYYQLQHYHNALTYHQRALVALQQPGSSASSVLRLKIEFHCGNALRTLGCLQQAHVHYERARSQLKAEHSMQLAGEIYLNLGYCTYAASLQQGKPVGNGQSAAITQWKQIELAFQQAISYLLQSRTVYQVSMNSKGEDTSRLLQSMILLDFCTYQRRETQRNNNVVGSLLSAACASLLDSAEEQCRQVLLKGTTSLAGIDVVSSQQECLRIQALAYLIQVVVQRSLIARLEKYDDTALRHRMLASSLYQQLLAALSEPEFSWEKLNEALNLQKNWIRQHKPFLPPLLCGSTLEIEDIHRPRALAESYFAAGVLAEELGYATDSQEYAHACFIRAQECFHCMTETMRKAPLDPDDDLNYVLRSYHSCLALLKERLQEYPQIAPETTQFLLNFLQEGLQYAYSQERILPASLQ